MSAQAIGSTLQAASGAQAAAARVEQLQALLQRTRALSDGTLAPPAAPASGAASTGSAAGFATALAAASPGAQAPAAAGSASAPYDTMVQQAALRNGLDPALLHGLIQQESGFDPSSQSSAGASGLTQLMPGTASSVGVSNPMDPAESIEGGARYLSQMMAQFGGNATEALAAYNAGPGAVKQYGGVPPYAETQSYVTKVLGYAEGYRREHPSTSATVGLA
jgi:soluble lytic murein transglycosylase-like protein